MPHKDGSPLNRLGQKQFGKLLGIVVIHNPKNRGDKRGEDDYDVHQGNDSLVHIVVKEQQDKTQHQVECEIHIAPAATHQIVKAVFEYLDHDFPFPFSILASYTAPSP